MWSVGWASLLFSPFSRFHDGSHQVPLTFPYPPPPPVKELVGNFSPVNICWVVKKSTLKFLEVRVACFLIRCIRYFSVAKTAPGLKAVYGRALLARDSRGESVWRGARRSHTCSCKYKAEPLGREARLQLPQPDTSGMLLPSRLRLP